MEETVMIECEECTNAKYSIVIVDPFLSKAMERAMKEEMIERLKKEEVSETDIFYGKVLKAPDSQALIAMPEMPYLGELMYTIKAYGIKDFIILDTATSLRPLLRVGSYGLVYAAQFNGFPTNYPLVADLGLLTEIMEIMGIPGLIAFTTFLPRQELPSILDNLKKRDFDVVDKNSASVYSLCHGRLRCVVIDFIDTSITKGIDKYTAWSSESKYYESVVDSLSEALNTLLGLELS